MAFTPLQIVLPKVTRNLSLDQQAIAAMVCESYRTHAAAIVHPQALTYTKPKYFRNGTLTISVQNAPWAQIVQWKKYDLKQILNKNLPSPFVREVKTVIEVTPHANPYFGEDMNKNFY